MKKKWGKSDGFIFMRFIRLLYVCGMVWGKGCGGIGGVGGLGLGFDGVKREEVFG